MGYVPPVVIDGLNVARNESFGHASPSGSARAVVAAIEQLRSCGHAVHVVLPQWAVHGAKDSSVAIQLSEAELLLPYLRTTVHVAPSGADDDRFILKIADSMSALIVTNDLFRDHIRSGAVSKEWVSTRCVKYMFVGCKLFTLPPASAAAPPLRPPSPNFELSAAEKAAACTPSPTTGAAAPAVPSPSEPAPSGASVGATTQSASTPTAKSSQRQRPFSRRPAGKQLVAARAHSKLADENQIMGAAMQALNPKSRRRRSGIQKQPPGVQISRHAAFARARQLNAAVTSVR